MRRSLPFTNLISKSSHDSAEHLLESHRTICNRVLQYSSQWFVAIVNCHFLTISVGVESREVRDNTKHLFLNLTIMIFQFQLMLSKHTV